MNPPCYDLHTHIVPGVDDGPVTPGEALRIIEKMRQAMPKGSVVAATSHFSTNMAYLAALSRADRSCRFVERASDDWLHVISAGELLLGMRKSDIYRLVSYPGTRTVLVEFTQGIFWFSVLRRIVRLFKAGYRPLLAHAERYKWATAARLRLLAGMGAGVSMSMRSLSIPSCVKRAEWIISSGMCHIVTSDCHTIRDMVLGDDARETVERLRPGGWKTLSEENPRIILDDCSLPPLGGAGRG
ncbi:MAG: CpsB/CapC family capsule biosynthesis tyrosine phosphatase [Candidatus Fermentibacteraceae bacterium]